LLEQHSESFIIWSAIIRINTEGKSLSLKLGPGDLTLSVVEPHLTAGPLLIVEPHLTHKVNLEINIKTLIYITI